MARRQQDMNSIPLRGLTIDRKGIDTLKATLMHEKTHYQVDMNWRTSLMAFDIGKQILIRMNFQMTGKMHMRLMILTKQRMFRLRGFRMEMMRRFIARCRRMGLVGTALKTGQIRENNQKIHFNALYYEAKITNWNNGGWGYFWFGSDEKSGER